MIETENQRRWWFATHPEYSWSGSRARTRADDDDRDDADKVAPEDVDAYVDNALQYVDGPVAAFLTSIKRNFGTEGDSQGRYQESDTSGWDVEAGGRIGLRRGSRSGRERRSRRLLRNAMLSRQCATMGSVPITFGPGCQEKD
jgi:hypothetical protein